MQLIKTLAPTIAALASTALATPTPAPPKAPSMEEAVRAMEAHCTPMGFESCALSMIAVGGSTTLHIVGVWDYQCKSLGSWDNIGESGTFRLNPSGLQDDIELTIDPWHGVLQPMGEMRYRGLVKEFRGNGDVSRWDCGDGVIGTECASIAFLCHSGSP